MTYKPQIVLAYFNACKLPKPYLEYAFHPERKWRFDFAWLEYKVALEVDGGIWIKGGHNRGAQIKKTWEKENAAQLLCWRIFKCEPCDLCTNETVSMIRSALLIKALDDLKKELSQ